MPYRNLSATELVRACVDSADQEAWGEFVRRFQPVIAGVALRTARRWGEASPLVIEDLVQEWSARMPVPPTPIRAYLTENIWYNLDEACLARIQLFYRYGVECGALPSTPELKFLG